MLLKTADDKAGDVRALEALLRRSDVDARQRRAIQDEIWAIRLGAKAEADAAYQLDFHLRDSKHWAVIHDLRIDIDGHVAQIDHLVVSRMLEVFVCESKSYTGGQARLVENARGARTRTRRLALASPGRLGRSIRDRPAHRSRRRRQHGRAAPLVREARRSVLDLRDDARQGHRGGLAVPAGSAALPALRRFAGSGVNVWTAADAL